MKKKNSIRITALLMTVCHLLCACNVSDQPDTGDTDVTAASTDTVSAVQWNSDLMLTRFSDSEGDLPMVQSENRYQTDEMTAIKDSYKYFGVGDAYINTEDQLCFSAYDGQQSHFLFMEKDGSIAEKRPNTIVYETNDQWIEGSGACYIMEDGSIYYTTYPLKYIEGTNHCWIHHINADGQLIASAVIPGTGSNRSMAVLTDRETPIIVVGASDSVCVYDLSLNLITELPGSVSGMFQQAPDGMLYGETDWVGRYLCFDPDALTLEAAALSKPNNIDHLAGMFFCERSSAYDRYYADRKGFWGYREGEYEAELLCSWVESDLTYDPNGGGMNIIAVWDENTLVVECPDPFTNILQPAILRRVSGEEHSRIRVTLAFADSYLASMKYPATNQILEYIADFNRNNDTYFIEYVDYADPAYVVNEWVGHPPAYLTPAFEEAALRNTAADLIVSAGVVREEMQKYVGANMFVNLYDAVSDGLLPCVVSGYQASDGGLYALPIGIRLHTLVSAGDGAIGEAGSLDLQMLYELAASCTEEISLFSSRGMNGSKLSQNMMAVTMASFADKTAKTCRYDTDAFAEFVRFYENLNDYRARWNGDTDGDGMFLDSEARYLIIGSAAYMEKVRNGEILLSELLLCDLNVFGSLYYLFDGNDFTLHGYPTENGERMLIDSDYDIHMNTDSKVQRGAAEFLAYLLSDRIQQTEALSMENFPITRSSFDAILDVRQFFRFNTETPVMDSTGDQVMVNQLVYDFPLPEKPSEGQADIPFTDEAKQRLRALFYDTPTQSVADSTLTSILNEELTAYQAGVRTLEEAQKILQSRLYIYVNE